MVFGLSSKLKPRRLPLLISIGAAFGVLGAWFLTSGFAATPVANIETESGVVSPEASTVNDASASGSQAVGFGTGGGGSSSDPCAVFPSLPSVKPTVNNTGVPPGTVLTNSGAIDVSVAGTVIDSKNVTGYIHIHADNVTVQNTKLKVTDFFGIKVDTGVTGVKILHSEVYTIGGGYIGITGGNMAICGTYIHGFENGITLTDGDTIAQANLIEKLLSDSAGAHYDGIEVYEGNNYKLWGNNIMMTDPSDNWRDDTGAINVTGQWSVVNNTEINGNWLGGGSYTLNFDNSQGYAVTNLRVTNNTFYGVPPEGHAQYGIVRQPELANPWSGNVWDGGGTATP